MRKIRSFTDAASTGDGASVERDARGVLELERKRQVLREMVERAEGRIASSTSRADERARPPRRSNRRRRRRGRAVAPAATAARTASASASGRHLANVEPSDGAQRVARGVGVAGRRVDERGNECARCPSCRTANETRSVPRSACSGAGLLPHSIHERLERAELERLLEHRAARSPHELRGVARRDVAGGEDDAVEQLGRDRGNVIVELHAGAARHLEVGDDDREVGLRRRAARESVGAVGRFVHLPSASREEALERRANRRLVVDDQHARAAGRLRGVARTTPERWPDSASSMRAGALDRQDDGEARAAAFRWPQRFSAVIRPPICCTMPSVTERPSPVPSPTGFVVKNGSKMRSITAGGMPGPESSTTIVSSLPVTHARSPTVPPVPDACAALIDEVRDDLLKSRAIGVADDFARRQLGGELRADFGDDRLQRAHAGRRARR